MWRSPPLAACPRGARRPALAADGKGGYVLAYEKDPDNRIAVRGWAGLDAPSAGRVERGFDAPRTLSRGAEGTPGPASVRDGTAERTGPCRANRDTDRGLRPSGGPSDLAYPP